VFDIEFYRTLTRLTDTMSFHATADKTITVHAICSNGSMSILGVRARPLPAAVYQWRKSPYYSSSGFSVCP